MQKRSTGLFILGIIVMVLVAIVASELLTFLNFYQENIDTNIAEAASASDFTAGYVANGDGLTDGEVPVGYAPSSGTAISTAAGLYSFLANAQNGSYGYLTNSITLDSNFTPYTGTSGKRAEDISFAAGAVLDGCGYTINITSGTITTDANSEQLFGGLMHSCAGTIKNLKIYSTSILDQTRSSETNSRQGIGLVVGTLTGVIDNCYIEWAGSGSFYTAKKSSNSDGLLGGVCAANNGGTIQNTTVNLTTTLTFECSGNSGLNKNWDMWVGGFAGESNGSSSVFRNVTITGTSSGGLYNYQNGSSGGGYSDTGAIVGWISQNCTIDGVKIGGAFNVTSSTSKDNHRGLIVGGNDDKTVSISNVYYSTQANNWYSRFGAGNTYTIGTNSDGCSSLYSYSVDDSKIGFCHNTIANLWVGDASTYSGSGNATTGNYVKTVTVGSAIDVSSLAAYGVTSGSYVPTIAKSNVNGDITAYSTGTYGYVANESSAVTGTGLSLSHTSTNIFTATYNASNLTAMSVSEKVYSNSSYISVTTPITSWATLPVKETGTYNLTGTKPGTGILLSSGNYYAVYADSYSASVTIDKNSSALALDTSSAISSLIYNAESQIGVTLGQSNLSGFLGDDASTE